MFGTREMAAEESLRKMGSCWRYRAEEVEGGKARLGVDLRSLKTGLPWLFGSHLHGSSTPFPPEPHFKRQRYRSFLP
jgi:hypothetical protein